LPIFGLIISKNIAALQHGPGIMWDKFGDINSDLGDSIPEMGSITARFYLRIFFCLGKPWGD